MRIHFFLIDKNVHMQVHMGLRLVGFFLFSFFYSLGVIVVFFDRRDFFFGIFFLINLGDCYFFFELFIQIYFFHPSTFPLSTKQKGEKGEELKIFSILPLFHSLTIFYHLIFPLFQPNKL